MSYTSKYTAEQIEDKLTQVFDSTLQTKEIELTSNGTTELTADAEFLGLKSVSVNVNVPQEGGGGNNWEYLKLSSEYALANLNLTKLIGIQGGVSATANGNTAYMGGLIAYDFIRQLDMAIEYGLTINYVTIKTDLSMMVSQVGTSSMYSLNDYLVSQGLSQSDIDSWERITEEEFYNLES